MSQVVLLGAGASRGTLGDCAPISSEFGYYLHSKHPDWKQKYPYLSSVVRFLKDRIQGISATNWALDKVWSAIDNRYKLRYILDLNPSDFPFPPPKNKKIYERSSDPWIFAGFELRCALAWVYGQSLENEIAEATQRNGTLMSVLDSLKPGDCIVSFNYDLLAERCLKKKVKRANQWLNVLTSDDGILLCKPHGSLNWKQWVPEHGRMVKILDSPMKEEDIDFNIERNATIQPGVVAPVPFKSEIIVPEIQKNVSDFFHLMTAQWRCAIQSLSKAEKLIVVGYGFPPEDLHAHYLFTEAGAMRNRELQVEVYQESSKNFEQVENQIKNIFKRAKCQPKGRVKAQEEEVYDAIR